MSLVGDARLESWLADVLGALSAAVTQARPLAGGAIQENWALDVEADGQAHALVLRRDAPATIPESRSRGEEFTILQAAHAGGVTVPRPVAFCEDAALIGAPFALLERVDGVGYGPKVVKDAGLGGDRAELGRRLGREMARIHAIRPEGALAELLGAPPENPGLAQIARLRAGLDAMGLRRPGLEWGLRAAELQAPPPAAPVLAHRDFRTGNLMVDAQGLTAVLDWEFAGWSDPMADLGWFCAECWRFSRPDLEGGGLCARDEVYAGYEAESGRAVDDARVRWWELVAHLRWALIALQQGERHASGRERSLHLALTGRIADRLELAALRMTEPRHAHRGAP